MKIKILCVTVMLVAGLFVTKADANSYFQAGLNLIDIQVDMGWASGSAEPRGVEARFGSYINPNIAVEGRLGFGLDDDKNIGLNRNIGLYFKGVMSSGGAVQPYVLAGFTNLGFDIEGESDSDNDFSYGFGATFGQGTKRFNIEWMRMYSDSGGGADLDIDAINLGIVFLY